MLESIGLAPTVESVYRAMLAHRDWSVRQIAADLNLAEDVVKALEVESRRRSTLESV